MNAEWRYGAVSREAFAGDLQAALEIVFLPLHPEERSQERLLAARSIVGRLERQVHHASSDGRREIGAELGAAQTVLGAITDLDGATIRKHLNSAANRLRTVLAISHG
jgi:hypothetical protein